LVTPASSAISAIVSFSAMMHFPFFLKTPESFYALRG